MAVLRFVEVLIQHVPFRLLKSAGNSYSSSIVKKRNVGPCCLMTEFDIVRRFGASVRKLRHGLGLSQEALAERADLHRTYIAGIEGGARNITLRSVDKLARALEVSTAVLISAATEPVVKKVNPKTEPAAVRFVDILLAEDNPEDAELTLQAFKRARLANSVQVAQDGLETLDYIFCRGAYAGRRMEEQPKLLLLDLNLPKVNGLEVLRRLKKDPRTQLIPVVILTGSQMERDIAECRRLGAASYIVKPVDFHNFSQVTPQLRLQWGLLRPAPATAL